MKSFVKFTEKPNPKSYTKTKRWSVTNSCSSFEIGEVKWFNSWRRYTFQPAPNCVFDVTCLSEIIHFINNVTMVRNQETEVESKVS